MSPVPEPAPDADAARPRSREEALFERCYDRLRQLAAAQMRDGARPGGTLQPTAVVHEAYLRMSDDADLSFNDTAHFVAAAAQTMRWILVDLARQRGSARRGGDRRREAIHPDVASAPTGDIDLVELDAALRALQIVNERQAQVVLLRYFGGLSIDETAEVLGVSRGSVKRDWRFARAWLLCELDDRRQRDEEADDAG